MPDPAAVATSLASGGLVGFSLGLVGGGGSILAVPLLVFLVGVGSPHAAIGTAAVAVAANALIGLIQHARAGNVRWPCAAVFSSLGVVGAYLGARLGQAVDGRLLLALFALLMAAVAVLMLAAPPRRRRGGDAAAQSLQRAALGRGRSVGGGTVGLLRHRRRVFDRAGSGLLGRFSDALRHRHLARGRLRLRHHHRRHLRPLPALVDWVIAALFVAGGAVGSYLGLRVVKRLSLRRGALETLFAGLILAVAAYTLWRSVGGL